MRRVTKTILTTLASEPTSIVAVQSVRSIEGPRNRKILGMSTPELIALGV